MIEGLIEIKQLPIIEEQLKNVSKEIDEKVKNATSLVCTDETVKTIKGLRADLNKELKEFETKRKEVKEKVLAPYTQFEEVYKACISDKYKNADAELKKKIDNVENELKTQKEQEVKEYFEEYRIANNVDFIKYEQAIINVTLSASMKSLKEQAKVFIDKIVDDLNLIEAQEHKTEILLEYKQSLNVSNAITTVANRFKAIEEEKKKKEELKTRLIQEASEEANKVIGITQEDKALVSDFIERAVERDSVLWAPTEEKQEEILTVSFKATATRTLLKELKDFMEERGIKYE